jgi:hypothetical protein
MAREGDGILICKGERWITTGKAKTYIYDF